MKRKYFYRTLATFALILGIGFAIPEQAHIPVVKASSKDWNPKSFWYEPWGASGVHKGIDIFAPQGRSVVSAVPGLVLHQGQLGIGGNVVAVLGPKWRVHYYAHLANADPRSGSVDLNSISRKISDTGQVVLVGAQAVDELCPFLSGVFDLGASKTD